MLPPSPVLTNQYRVKCSRTGVLVGWIGSAKQVKGAQEAAKDLISRSISVFEVLQDARKVAEAQTDLAYCYWRQGALDEARVLLKDVLSGLPDEESSQKAVVYIRSALLENSAARFNDSFRILSKASRLFNESTSHALQGEFHNTLALALRNLGTTEHRDDYVDRALIEYAAASFHFEQAGHTRYQACVENNLAFLFLTLARLTEAHQHLDCARRLLVDLRDNVHVAQVDDTRARVLLAEGRNSEAERVAQAAVATLEKGGEQSLLTKPSPRSELRGREQHNTSGHSAHCAERLR